MMANEEQRRAFASYMGTAGASGGQQTPPASGAYANPTNPYLYQQFPGVQGLPAAPTPPPAAPSSVASHPSYMSSFQLDYPQSQFQQGGYQQSPLPQRPPLLGQSEALQSHQSMQPASGQPSYYSSYQEGNRPNNQPPQRAEYNTAWRYADPMVRQGGHLLSGNAASRGVMIPHSRNISGEIVESRKRQASEQRYYYRQYGQPQPGTEPASLPVDEQTVPVLLCHTCSVCSRMRSAGYHRNNPVIPGKPLVLAPCRRCRKKIKGQRRSLSSFTHIRSCTAEEPCDWPREPTRADRDYDELETHEQRGRRLSREAFHVHRQSLSRPRIIRHSSRQTRFGLRSLQQEPSIPRIVRDKTKVGVSSLSPPRVSGYENIWPPPDVVHMRSAQARDTRPAQSSPNVTLNDEIWPPPDAVRTHASRRLGKTRLRRESSRVPDLSPSPPPVCTRSTRVVYRKASTERRPRSVSPVHVSSRDERESGGAEARIMAHPRAYRPVAPDRRKFARASEETSSSADYMAHGSQDSPSQSILKQPSGERETSRRRMSMRESQQSTTVEVGGPRVHFGLERRKQGGAPSSRGRPQHEDDARRSGEDYGDYRGYGRHRSMNDSQPAPPVEEMERVRIRRASVSPRRSYEEDILLDRAQRISPSPPLSPPSGRYGEIRVRHISPLPIPSRSSERGRTLRLRHSSSSPRRPAPGFYRYVTPSHAPSRSRSLTPLPKSESASVDMTDSDSAHSGEITEVRSWRGIDENGQPATFVEERRTVRTIKQEGEKDGLEGYGNMGASERLGNRVVADV